MQANVSSASITLMLYQWKEGDKVSFDKLIEIVYDELYKRARFYLGSKDRHLSCTTLVNEAYLQLVEEKDRNWQNRDHFFSVAALIMRHLITRFAQKNKADKRGGRAVILSPDNMDDLKGAHQKNLLAIDESLNALEKIDPRKVKAIEMVYLVGLSHQETAKILEISVATLKRDLAFASAWLDRHMQGD